MGNIASETSKDFKDIFNRFRKKDFSGNSGQAIKNSGAQMATTIIMKLGSLIFTVVLARILMPELFGLFNLALSTILIFAAFSDLGIAETATRFMSLELEKRNLGKAKGYFSHLSKIKLLIISVISLVLLFSSKFLADNYYQKPLFLALLAGILYISTAGLMTMLQSHVHAFNRFQNMFYKEIVFQAIRIILIPLFVIFVLKNSMNDNQILFYLMLGLSFAYFVSYLFLAFISRKNYPIREKEIPLDSDEKKKLNRFLLSIFAIVLSGVFFSYVDKIILGRFVEAEFIGYYSAAFSFISGLVPLISFSTALLPVFSRMKKENLGSLFKKSRLLIFFFSLLLTLFLIIFAPFLIKIIFGADYLLSTNILRLFSIILIPISLTGLLSTYLISVGKPIFVTKAIVSSTVLNIILNFALISWLIKYNPLYATYGAVIAAVISNFFYLFSLVIFKKSVEKSL